MRKRIRIVLKSEYKVCAFCSVFKGVPALLSEDVVQLD